MGDSKHREVFMSVSRRTLLAAGPAAAVAFAMPAGAQTSSPIGASPAGRQAPGFYRYKIGDIEITAIHDGSAPRPLENFVRNADIAEVRKAAEEAFLPTDAYQNTFTPMVLRSGGKTILIDTGLGDTGAPTTGLAVTNLRAAGFDPARVDVVIISHFHGDHINGLRLKDGTAVYPNAEIMVPAPEWAFWMDDARMAQAPEGLKGSFQNARRVFGPNAKDVTQFEWGKEIAPGITAIDASGHTPGHTAFVIQSAGKSLTHVVDLTNHPRLFVRHPDWSAVFDMDADKARATRRKMLDMAAAERTQLAFFHAPFPATGHVRKEGNGFEYVPVQWMSAI
jgi:glyoxylase-like metal-dependent hydrolase (beta-lactamase superfamily II)